MHIRVWCVVQMIRILLSNKLKIESVHRSEGSTYILGDKIYFLIFFKCKLIPHQKISGVNISKLRVIYCRRFIRSLIGSHTNLKLKVFGEQLQSSCRRVHFDSTVLDSKGTFHRHCLNIKHIEWSDKFGIVVYKKYLVTGKKNVFLRFFLGF